MSTRHDSRAFAFSGELAQVYARDCREPADAPLVYLAPGEADRVRDDCRGGHLVCPFDSCDAPAFWASGGSGGRRHHFRHRHVPAGAHTPESYFHLVGKHAVAAWLRRAHPEARAELERETSDRTRRADVLAVFPDGRRFAFEIQYALIGADEWRERHESYRAQGIRDVWLFGHTSTYLGPSKQEWLEGRVHLNETLLAVREAGCRVRFLNPDELTIGSQLIELDPSWHAERHSLLQIDGLDECRLVGERLITPTDQAEIAAIRERRNREERAARIAAQREESRSAWIARDREARERDWLAFEPEFLAAVGLAEAPPLVTDEQKGDRGIFMHPAHWHALVWLELHGRLGDRISFNSIASQFAAKQRKHARFIWTTLAAYLFRLRRAGYLYISHEGGFIHEVVPLAELAEAPSAALRQACLEDGNRIRFAQQNGCLVAVSGRGEVLASLRDVRADDGVLDLAECRAKDEPCFDTPVSHACPATASVPARRLADQARSDAEAFTVDIPAAAYTRILQSELRAVLLAHPGDQRVLLVVHDAVPGFDRLIDRPERVDGSELLRAAIEERLSIVADTPGIAVAVPC